jgi:hypothetical protein
MGIRSAAFGRTLSWVRIDSDEGGEVKSLFPAEVRLVVEALGADVWPTEMFRSGLTASREEK